MHTHTHTHTKQNNKKKQTMQNKKKTKQKNTESNSLAGLKGKQQPVCRHKINLSITIAHNTALYLILRMQIK